MNQLLIIINFKLSTFSNIDTIYAQFFDNYTNIFNSKENFFVLATAIYIAVMGQLIEKHQGKIVEKAIKKTGYQMKAVAKGLGIARNTLYIRLKQAQLDDSFIINVSNVIHYDFSDAFPEVYKRVKERIDNNVEQFYPNPKEDMPCDELPHYEQLYKNPYFLELQALTQRYLTLMGDYHKLLKILTLLANSNDLIDIKKDIVAFLSNTDKES